MIAVPARSRLALFAELSVLTALLATPLAVHTQIHEDYVTSQWLFLQWMLAITVAVMAALRLRQPLPRIPWGGGLVIAFGAWMTLSVLWSESVSFSIQELCFPIAGIALYLLVVTCRMPTGRLSQHLMLAIVAVAVVNAALGSLQFIFQFLGWERASEILSYKVLRYGTAVLEGKKNIRALFAHPNFLAGYLAPALAITVHIAWTRRSAVARVLMSLMAVGIMGCLVICRSRSGWLAFFVMMLCSAAVAWRHRRLTWMHVAMIAGVLIFTAIGVWELRERSQRRGWEQVATLSTLTSRLHGYGIAGQMFSERPVLGWGIGRFKSGFYDEVITRQTRDPYADLYSEFLRQNQGLTPYHVHNDLFEIAVELGIVGISLFLAILAWTAVRLGRVILRSPVTGNTWFAVTLGVAILAMLSDMMLSFPLSLPMTNSLFWILMALAHRVIQEEGVGNQSAPGTD